MTVGTHEDVVGGVHDHRSVRQECGPHSLCEEANTAWREPEELVPFEEGLRGTVVRQAGHDVQRDRCRVPLFQGQYLPAMNLKQRGTADGSHGERALGTVESKPRSLSAGHEKHAHASLPQGLFAGGQSRPGPKLLSRNHLGGRHPVGLPVMLRLSFEQGAHERHGVEIDLRDLGEQSLPPSLVQPVPETQQVFLAVGAQPFKGICVSESSHR